MNASPSPYIGQIVTYTLSGDDATQVNRRRTNGPSIAERIKQDKWPIGAQAHIGNEVQEGQSYPMIIVRVWSSSCVNGQVFLDGTDTLWALSVNKGVEDDLKPGTSQPRTWF